MAGDSIIGALRVVLGADTAAFESGLKSAQTKASNFAASVGKIAAGIGLEHGLEKLIENIVHSFKAAIEHADQLGKTAQKVGLPVEQLSKLSLAATLSDVSMESLSTGLGKLSKAMVEVARGGGDAANLAFRQLGVSVTSADGTLRSTGDVLADLAGKFGGLNDGAAKTAVAMALFGKTGKDMIPLLNEGKDGLQEMMKAAENMGLVISTKTAAQSQHLMDNIKLLDAAKQGLTNTIVAALLPALVRLSNQWVETAKDGSVMRSAAEFIVDAIKSVVVSFQVNIVEAQRMGLAIQALWNAVAAFPNIEESRKWFAELKKIVRETPDALDAAKKSAEEFFTAIEVHNKPKVDLGIDANLQKALDDLSLKTRIVKGDFDALAQGFPDLAKGLGLFGMSANESRTSVESLSPALKKLNEAQNAYKAAQITQDSLLPWQQFEQQLMRINVAFADGAKNPEAYAQAMKKAADSAGVSWNLASANIAGSFATIAGSFGQTSGAMATAAKAFAIVQAIISAYTGAAKALELPFPANIAAAAAVLAQGFTFVANIKTQAVPKFAKGGSFTVPGGISGTDNMMVPLNLASGERVDITAANEARRGANRIVEHVLKANSIRDIFTGENLRDLFYLLNEGHRDGYRLKFAVGGS